MRFTGVHVRLHKDTVLPDKEGKMKKNKALRIYILILFLIPLVTPHFDCLWCVFLCYLMSLPVHSVILGVIAGRNMEKRRFFPLIPLLLLAASYLFSFTYYKAAESSHHNLFGYIINRCIEAYTIMGMGFSDHMDVNNLNGTVQPEFDRYGTFGYHELPIPLVLLFSSPLFCWISMRITALLHREKNAD